MNEAVLLNISFLFLRLQFGLRWTPWALAGTNRVQTRLLPTRDFVTVSLLSASLIIRWILVGHVPISNLYESLLFLAWGLRTGLGFLQRQGAPGVIIARRSRCPLLVLGFASFCLPAELRLAGPLVPALKSNWLLRHVTVRILSYAGLRLGSLRSVLYLSTQTFFASSSSDGNTFTDRLDQWSYRRIAFGFPFLTLGILSGAVWANETWGSYWSWDPKETWSLITWLVFAVYLHTRLVQGKQGIVPARVAAGGFIRIWICYLGVNLLGKGLHSYGFFS